MPVSATAKCSADCARRDRDSTATLTTTSPRSVNLTALPTRLTRTCRSRPASPTRTSGTSAADLAGQFQPLLVRPQGQRLQGVAQGVAQVEGDCVQLQLARLDLGEVEDVVDDRQQRLGRTPGPSRGTRAARAGGRCPAPARSCRGCRSWACGSRGSCWPGTRSWPGWPPRPPRRSRPCFGSSAVRCRHLSPRRRALAASSSACRSAMACISCDALPAGPDQEDVLEDDPAGVLQPAPVARRRARRRPTAARSSPRSEVVGGDDRRGGDQHAPVAVEGQEGQRAEDVEVRLDAAAGQVDQQGAHEHLADGDGVARRTPRRAAAGPRQHGRLTIAPPRKSAAQTCGCVWLSAPAQVQRRDQQRGDDRRPATGRPAARRTGGRCAGRSLRGVHGIGRRLGRPPPALPPRTRFVCICGILQQKVSQRRAMGSRRWAGLGIPALRRRSRRRRRGGPDCPPVPPAGGEAAPEDETSVGVVQEGLA